MAENERRRRMLEEINAAKQARGVMKSNLDNRLDMLNHTRLIAGLTELGALNKAAQIWANVHCAEDTAAVEEFLKDCTLIGDEQGFILRCMVYGIGT